MKKRMFLSLILVASLYGSEVKYLTSQDVEGTLISGVTLKAFNEEEESVTISTKNCNIVASAKLNLTSERAEIYTKSVNCTIDNMLYENKDKNFFDKVFISHKGIHGLPAKIDYDNGTGKIDAGLKIKVTFVNLKLKKILNLVN